MENLATAILMTLATVAVIGIIWLIVGVVREVIDSVTFSSTITWKTFFNRVLAVILIIIVITAFWYVVIFV